MSTDPLPDQSSSELRRIGDQLQSEASRLSEWVMEEIEFSDLPYEVGQALIGVRSTVDQWTVARRGEFR